MAPEIVRVAWHDAIFEFDEDGLPVPEPAIPNRENDRRYSEAPDEEVHSNIPTRVNGAAVALKESKEEEKRVVEESEKDLLKARSAERPSRGSRGFHWIPHTAIDVSRGACEADGRMCRISAGYISTYRSKR